MQFEGAVIREQGVTFAIVVVKSHVISSVSMREETTKGFASYFPSMPIILMAQDSKGRPTYFGRKDIVDFLSKVNPSRIPWKRYTV